MRNVLFLGGFLLTLVAIYLYNSGPGVESFEDLVIEIGCTIDLNSELEKIDSVYTKLEGQRNPEDAALQKRSRQKIDSEMLNILRKIRPALRSHRPVFQSNRVRVWDKQDLQGLMERLSAACTPKVRNAYFLTYFMTVNSLFAKIEKGRS